MAEKQTAWANLYLDSAGLTATSSPTAASWELGVTSVLNALINVPPFQSSRDVINAICRAPFKMVIVPETGGGASENADNLAAATPKGHVVRDGAGNPVAGSGPGTGVGSSVKVWFTSQNHPGGANPGDPQDEILLHEMVHGLRDQNHVSETLPRAGFTHQHYDTLEEFYAIVIENIYRSECKREGVRRDHHGHVALEAPLTNETTFYNTFKDDMDRLVNDMPLLSVHLSVVPCVFNPIRAALHKTFDQNTLVALHNLFVNNP